MFATRCVDASVRLLRGVLAQHHACGELTLAGAARRAARRRRARRRACRRARRGAQTRARVSAKQGSAKRRKFSRIADRRRNLSVGVAAVATLRCSPPRVQPRTPWARARSSPRWRGRRAPAVAAGCDAVRVRGMKGLDSPSRGPEHLLFAPRAHARARRGVAVHTVGAKMTRPAPCPHGRFSSVRGKTVFSLRVAAFEVKVGSCCDTTHAGFAPCSPTFRVPFCTSHANSADVFTDLFGRKLRHGRSRKRRSERGRHHAKGTRYVGELQIWPSGWTHELPFSHYLILAFILDTPS